ncbi:ketopantoate reductase [Arthrobacter sp. CAN_A212]|uniref:hypothetical protein n=1 Tax=Arthrobacter sp. CAN_A212 TaxID=2787719 RepID=UPI0018CA53CC
MRKRPTEVPTQYLPVIQLGAEHGIAKPLLIELVSLIQQLENQSIQMTEEHLTALDTKAAARA